MSSAIAKPIHGKARPDRDNCNRAPQLQARTREVRPCICIWEARYMHTCAQVHVHVCCCRVRIEFRTAARAC